MATIGNLRYFAPPFHNIFTLFTTSAASRHIIIIMKTANLRKKIDCFMIVVILIGMMLGAIAALLLKGVSPEHLLNEVDVPWKSANSLLMQLSNLDQKKESLYLDALLPSTVSQNESIKAAFHDTCLIGSHSPCMLLQLKSMSCQFTLSQLAPYKAIRNQRKGKHH